MSYTIETIAERIGARRVGDTPATISLIYIHVASVTLWLAKKPTKQLKMGN